MSGNYITFEDLKLRLTPAQRKAAELIVANDFAPKDEKKTLEEIADEVRVDRRTLYDWRQNPDFTRYAAAITDNELDRGHSFVTGRLMWLIENGASNNGVPPIKAIELYYKLTGRLVDRSVVMTNEDSRNPKITQEEINNELDKLDKLIQ